MDHRPKKRGQRQDSEGGGIGDTRIPRGRRGREDQEDPLYYDEDDENGSNADELAEENERFFDGEHD